MSRFLLATALLASLAMACARQPTATNGGQSTREIEVAAGSEFALAAGHTARVAGTELLIHFAGVDEDSRCPTDVDCVWQGDAAVRLEISSRIAEFAPQAVILHTGVEPRERSILGISVRLVDLAPDPISTRRIDPRSYTARLLVTR